MSEKYHFGRPIPKSIALVAMGRSRIDYGTHATNVGHYHEVAEEIWVINKMISYIYNDICFRMDDLMHNRDLMPEAFRKTLQEHPLIVTSKAYPEEFPGSVEFPLVEVINDIGIPYFNTTPAYALAYAIYLGIPEIHIYGCDFTYPAAVMAEEGRGCFEMMMGIAYGRGIALMVGPNTSLMDTCIPIEDRFYGYNDKVNINLIDGKWVIGKNA